jgi:hypothetical protein
MASDCAQWILQRRKGDGWRAVSFVSSTKDVLARCMREKGTPAEDTERLLGAVRGRFSASLNDDIPSFSKRGVS